MRKNRCRRRALPGEWLQVVTKVYGPLGLMGRELVCQTSELGSNPSWDATVHPVCEILIVMRAV